MTVSATIRDAPGAAQYRRLVDALEHVDPDCLGDDRFIADDWPLQERGELALICSACPLARVCLEYARKARPESGFWAGRTWTNTKEKL